MRAGSYLSVSGDRCIGLWSKLRISSKVHARLSNHTDVICMFMGLLMNVADSEEKHERIENSTQQSAEQFKPDLDDTSQFFYLLSSFSICADLTNIYCHTGWKTLLAF